MWSLFSALLVSLLGVLLSALFQWTYRRGRRARLDALELKPNCLLTRYPIVFLSGPRSLFRLFDHWSEVPAYLREHGYEVLVVEPQNPRLASRIDEVLRELPPKFHVIADASTHSVLEEIAALKNSQVVSLNLIRSRAYVARAEKMPAASAHDLKPLGTPIETFELAIPRTEFRRDWKTLGVRFLTCLLTAAHNRVFAKNSSRVDPLATAGIETLHPWFIELKFLDLVVGLAERDACET